MKRSQNDSSRETVLFPMASPQALAAADIALPMRPPGLGQPFVNGALEGPAGKIPRVSSTLTWQDRWGSIKARLGVGRMMVNGDLLQGSQSIVDSRIDFDNFQMVSEERDGGQEILPLQAIGV